MATMVTHTHTHTHTCFSVLRYMYIACPVESGLVLYQNTSQLPAQLIRAWCVHSRITFSSEQGTTLCSYNFWIVTQLTSLWFMTTFRDRIFVPPSGSSENIRTWDTQAIYRYSPTGSRPIRKESLRNKW
jgi:hypothetical protein